MGIINYGKQTIDSKDIESVVSTLKGNFLTCGPKINEFEESFKNYVGAKYALAVSNGTAALHLACLAANLKEGDELITSPITFVASANCALYCRAKPIFADINEKGIIDSEEIFKKITNKTKIIIPVHYGGLPADLEKIKKIADEKKLIIIEDACHALGTEYRNSKIGDCKYSDMCIFSFHPVKAITTGEGGMITTNSKEFYEKLKLLRAHGIEKDNSKFIYQTEEPWRYEMQLLGFNYRITDIQCSLGISQLQKIDYFVKKRREIAKKYDLEFAKMNEIEIIQEENFEFNSYHLYIIKLKDKDTRLKLFNFLRKNNIYCQVHYIPVYTQPYYEKLGYKKGICPNSEKFYDKIISLPIYPDLTIEQQEHIIKKIGEFFKNG
jgi:UDP-4-amino-4,6-dideoxy-N-acetyl-beta-L-altrosamine transaminase